MCRDELDDKYDWPDVDCRDCPVDYDDQEKVSLLIDIYEKVEAKE